MTEPTTQREGVHKMLDDLEKKLKEVKEKSAKEHSFITDLLRLRARGKLKRLTDDQYKWLCRIHIAQCGKPLAVNINNLLNRKVCRVPRS